MGEVVPARISPTQHPPSPPTVHQLSRLALQELMSLFCDYTIYEYFTLLLPNMCKHKQVLLDRILTNPLNCSFCTCASVGRFSAHGFPLNSEPEFQWKSLMHPPDPNSLILAIKYSWLADTSRNGNSVLSVGTVWDLATASCFSWEMLTSESTKKDIKQCRFIDPCHMCHNVLMWCCLQYVHMYCPCQLNW